MEFPELEHALSSLFGRPAPHAKIVALKGDASTRRYFRVYLQDRHPSRVIVMQLPEDRLGSDEGGTQPAPNRLPFVEVAELLYSRGLPVPRIYAEDLARGLVLLEDLGDLTMYEAVRRVPRTQWFSFYERAVDLLAEMHERCRTLSSSSIVMQRRFDRELLEWELEHFREWGLEGPFGELSQPERAALRRSFEQIVDEIGAMPFGFVHRDYQSKNLMVQPDGALALIDFQDALVGPRVYDLAALLCDSYVPLDEDLQNAMLDRYAAARRIDPDTIRFELGWVALHRKLKDAGRFVYIDRVRNNPDFLRWYPQSLVYVGRALDRTPNMSALREILARRIPGFPDAVSQPASSLE